MLLCKFSELCHFEQPDTVFVKINGGDNESGDDMRMKEPECSASPLPCLLLHPAPGMDVRAGFGIKIKCGASCMVPMRKFSHATESEG